LISNYFNSTIQNGFCFKKKRKEKKRKEKKRKEKKKQFEIKE